MDLSLIGIGMWLLCGFYWRLYEGGFCVFYEYGRIDSVISVWGTAYTSLSKNMIVLSVLGDPRRSYVR